MKLLKKQKGLPAEITLKKTIFIKLVSWGKHEYKISYTEILAQGIFMDI